jgi:hypothetical protein
MPTVVVIVSPNVVVFASIEEIDSLYTTEVSENEVVKADRLDGITLPF